MVQEIQGQICSPVLSGCPTSRNQQDGIQNLTGNPGSASEVRLQLQLPDLGGIEGNEVEHTFRAQSIYCIQTVQWSCGIPVGWGKCYRSESTPQVLSVLDRIWLNQKGLRPAFMAYDNACNLLRHIATQDAQAGAISSESWLHTTKFVVDTWHYVGHKVSDILCRLWCNPCPSNGTQPDLVVVQEDWCPSPYTGIQS